MRQIGTLGTIDTVTVGGRVFTDLTNLKILMCKMTTGSPNSTAREVGSGTAAGYQVPGGKTFKVLAVRYVSLAAASSVAVAQSNNDTGYSPNSTALTSPIYVGSNTTEATSVVESDGSIGVVGELSLNFSVAATRYITSVLVGSATSTLYIFGYEV